MNNMTLQIMLEDAILKALGIYPKAFSIGSGDRI
jgi:hypothetical protein